MQGTRRKHILLPRGRLQAFTLAWDTHRKRWFDLNPQRRIDHRDELHWSKPAYNWNFMCAECHATNVRKNYDSEEDGYSTEFSQVNVGCQACHGPASAHLSYLRASVGPGVAGNGPQQAAELRPDQTSKPAAATMRSAATHFSPVASHLSSIAEIEACARCHSRRSVLSADYRHGAALMNTHSPALLEESLYFDDGQIRDEVFEYGSFLQSRMHAKGVRCSDCHEPHSLQTRAQGNALCTTCHNEGAPALRHSMDISDLKRMITACAYPDQTCL